MELVHPPSCFSDNGSSRGNLIPIQSKSAANEREQSRKIPLMVSLAYPEACLELGRKALEGNHVSALTQSFDSSP